ncbi:MAG: PorT family protein [Clostridium sp.]|nr:PorT family protein [Clostridium sp.]
MKRISALIAALIIMMNLSTAKAEFRYGPMVGADFTNMSFKQDLFQVDGTVGGSAGIMAEMMFPGIGFGIDFGMNYSLRGARLHLGERELWQWQGYGTERLSLHTLVVPFHLRFKYTRLGGLEDRIAPFVYAGPSFAFNVGHSKLDAFDFAGGDVGIDVGIGCELYQRFQISGGYTFGMTYAMKAKILTDFSARSNQGFVRFAWLF